ncbi:hypothetical protein MUU53_09910 [Rhizobium lemnae]|uniref:Uncharacterized protein n=1 Tax=Rhizobium lemnae TaxID=1214924 RepID=A0ABV8E617_9HYPH|nr:hypothetical protein [Rhizobium lemnae]MCJ8508226.1 hypothetical protein [Rhizobium lemnae]
MKLMSAVVLAAVVALPAISASAVNAREIERYEYKDTRECYRVQKVPAKIVIETRGQLVRPGGWEWKDDEFEGKSRVEMRKLDDVYIAVPREEEPQHTTLFKIKC